jgi:hypothetical protein
MAKKTWQEELLEARGVKVPKGSKGSKGSKGLRSGNICPICDQPVRPGQSHSTPAPDFSVSHFWCVYPKAS